MRHPPRLPREKQLAVMPWMSASLVWGKVLMKSELIKMPLVIPYQTVGLEGFKGNYRRYAVPDRSRTTPERC